MDRLSNGQTGTMGIGELSDLRPPINADSANQNLVTSASELGQERGPRSPLVRCVATTTPAIKNLFANTRDKDHAIKKLDIEVSMLRRMSPNQAQAILGFKALVSPLTKVEISEDQLNTLKITQECIDWVKEKMPHPSNQLHGILHKSGESIWRGILWEAMSNAANLRKDYAQVGIDALCAGSGNCNAYAKAILAKLMASVTLPLGLIEAKGSDGHKHVFAVVGNLNLPDQLVIADAWPRNGRACFLKHFPSHIKLNLFAQYSEAELKELRPIVTRKLATISTMDFAEVQKKVESYFGKITLPPPGAECLHFCKTRNVADPSTYSVYDCKSLVDGIFYHNASKNEFFDPVGTSPPFAEQDLGPVAQFGTSASKH